MPPSHTEPQPLGPDNFEMSVSDGICTIRFRTTIKGVYEKQNDKGNTSVIFSTSRGPQLVPGVPGLRVNLTAWMSKTIGRKGNVKRIDPATGKVIE